MGLLHKGKLAELYRGDDIVNKIKAYFLRVQGDLDNSVGQAWRLGVEGAVFWGDLKLSSSAEKCNITKNFVDSTLGPFVQNLLQPQQKPADDGEVGWWHLLKMYMSLAFRVFTNTGIMFS